MRKPTASVAVEDQMELLFDNASESGKQPEFVLLRPKLKSVFKMDHIFYIKNKQAVKCSDTVAEQHALIAREVAGALRESCPEYLNANFLQDTVWFETFMPHYVGKLVNMAAPEQKNNANRGVYALAYDLLKGLIMEYTVNTVFSNEYYGKWVDGYTPVDTELFAQANGKPYKIDVKYVPGDFLRDNHFAVGTYNGWIPAGKLSAYKNHNTGKYDLIKDGKESIDAETSAFYNQVVRDKMKCDYVLVTAIFEGINMFYGVVNRDKYKNYALVTKYGSKFSDRSRSIVVAKGNFVRDLHNRFQVREGYQREAADRILFT